MANWHRFLLVAVGLLLLSVSGQAQKTKETFGSSFSQYANEPNKEQWINGALIPNNSQYYEGTSTLQRLVLVNIPATTGNNHLLEFRVLATKGGVNAYDFVTGFDQALKDYNNITGGQIKSGTFNPTSASDRLALVTAAGIPNPATASMISSLFTSGVTAVAAAPASQYTTSPISTVVAGYDNTTYPGFSSSVIKRGVQLYGLAGSTITNAVMEFGGYTAPDLSGDSYGIYRLSWTSASKNVLILAGGHLATGNNGSPYSDLWVGVDKGASDISGGPYHFKLEKLDGASLGNQDNQIQSGAISVFQSDCQLNDNISVCVGNTVTYTASSTATGAHYAWSLTGDGEFVGGAPGDVSSVQVRAKSGVTGTITVSVSITATGYIGSSCSDEVTVNALPSATMSNTGPICAGSSTNVSINFADGTGPWSFKYTINGANEVTVTNNTTDPYTFSTGALSANATYALTSLTNGNSCSAATLPSTEVVVNANPTITAPAIGAICAGATSASLSYTGVTGGADQYKIIWSAAANTAGLSNTSYSSLPSSPFNITVPGTLAPTTYAGTIYVKNSTTTCESAGAAISLVVNANPTASAGDAPAAQCLDEAGNTFQLDGSGTNGTFKWTVQSKSDAAMGVEFSDDAIAKPTVTVTGGVYGTVTLRLTVTSNATPSCGSQYSDVTVTINDLPTPPDVTYNAPACNSAFFSVTVNSPEVGTYILSRTGYDDIKIVSDGTNEVLFEKLAAGSGYSVVYENSSKCVSGANNCGGAGLIGKSSSSALQTTDKATPTQRSIRTEAYPNPTGRDATINFSVPRSGHVKVDVYNALGRYVTTLFDGEAKGGESHSVVLKGAQLPTGTYYYKVTTDGKTKTNRISLVK